ncbi:hypothetical protein OH76DRAFT_817787 [Lentinus brumalis]|uniref:Uncharacterized protein n=1 Tax=Lentinus brumalis TaxID=2498619 RepID=A0A371D2S2_9APHY|nr:hypothetical protein OH76DRAFT_817787 [Polyporus brumalis]
MSISVALDTLTSSGGPRLASDRITGAAKKRRRGLRGMEDEGEQTERSSDAPISETDAVTQHARRSLALRTWTSAGKRTEQNKGCSVTRGQPSPPSGLKTQRSTVTRRAVGRTPRIRSQNTTCRRLPPRR